MPPDTLRDEGGLLAPLGDRVNDEGSSMDARKGVGAWLREAGVGAADAGGGGGGGAGALYGGRGALALGAGALCGGGGGAVGGECAPAAARKAACIAMVWGMA